ncbi:protein kinase domain-containing protein [Corynebacterium variabile]|uniref:protein kinase domain-containing protein n=1 Tax=Corynebacterium variabile TaxID=1727 RepID=UPI0028969ADE|nr:NERD domain-containing protein [Corynebacterium variabile]
MDQNSPRWHEVTPSEFPHEREGLAYLAKSVPDQAPYQVFTNFTFQGDNGRRFEVDALVVSPAQINLIELKHWNGHLTGNDHTWHSDWNGGSTKRNPLNAANYKAKLFKSRLETILRRMLTEHRGDPANPESFADVPWIQESVFLHNERITTDFTAQGVQNVFGIDGLRSSTNLPGIGNRITENVRRYQAPIDEGFARRMLLPAITEITGYRKRRIQADEWVLTKHVDDEEDRQVWAAENARDRKDRAVVRVIDIPRNADRIESNRLHAGAHREYELLKGLTHPNIEAPFAFKSTDVGAGDAPALVYRPTDGFEPLDLLYPGLVLTAAQQVELITQVADALTYAHANNVVHRRLTPAAVLLNTKSLDRDNPAHSTIEVKVSRWTAVSESVQSTRLRSALAAQSGTTAGTKNSTSFDETAGFLPPEGFDGLAERTVGDLFSVGALAYFIFSGGRQPATTRAELDRVLTRSGGLDLDATDAQVEEHIRDLVLGVTSPSPTTRLSTVEPKSGRRGKGTDPVKLFLDKLQDTSRDRLPDEGDALHPKVGELLDDRFTMVKQLGTGSTALGLLVQDNQADNSERVLKVARSEDVVADLEHEAESLTELSRKLADDPQKKHFVELLEPTLRLPFNRTALLLSFGGEFTLADQLQMGPLGADQFWTHGEQLLTLLVALENTGLTHRDIKPANLGLLGKPSAKTLVLFDFSLTHKDLTATDLGTRPYLDPFLSKDTTPARPHFDSYAERYSALVVLLQMATADYPRYGSDDGTAAALTDGHLSLSAEDFPTEWPAAQREALTALFADNLDRDLRRRAGSAQDLLESFRSIRRRRGTIGTSDAAETQQTPETTPVPELTVTRTPSGVTLLSLNDLSQELAAYSGAKGSHERRLVQNILGVAKDATHIDPFIPASGFAEILETSPGKMPALMAAVAPVWDQTPALRNALDALSAKLATVLRSLGGIGTPDDLRPVVEELFPSAASGAPTPGSTPGQNARRQLGVLRLLEMTLSRRADGDGRVHLIRRAGSGDAAAVALTDDAALTGLPAALAEAARILLGAAPHEIVDATALVTALSNAAVEYLGVAATDLQVPPSMLPRLAVAADGALALTASGDLYPMAISTESLVRAVFPTAADRVDRHTLANKVQRRFPEAVHAKLPAHPKLTEIVTALVPDLVYDAAKKAWVRPTADQPSSVLETRLTRHTTVGLSDRPRADLPERSRVLLDGLEATLRDRYFRVVPVATGEATQTVDLIVSSFGARHVDIAEVVLDELWNMFEQTGQTSEAFTALLDMDAADNPARPQLAQLIRVYADKALKNALATTDPSPVILTDASILANFGCLDVLAPWMQIGADNPVPVWLITVDDSPSLTNAHAVEGVQLPLSSPGQVLGM